MAKVDKQTKAEVAQLLRELSNSKTAKDSARLAGEIEKKVTKVTTKS